MNLIKRIILYNKKLPINFHSAIINGNKYMLNDRKFYVKGDDISFISKHNILTNEQKKKIEEEVSGEVKNWVSYGFSYTDRDEDTFNCNAVQFMLYSVFLCTSIFIFMYLPYAKDMDWCMREAYLELARREKLGLHLIDPNYVPLDRIELPTEEELINIKIIV